MFFKADKLIYAAAIWASAIQVFLGKICCHLRSCNAIPGLSPRAWLESAPAHGNAPPAAATAAKTSSSLQT